jgi:hypothetical protein
MSEQAPTNSADNTISEAEFIKLCEDVYADRYRIYQFNPGACKREALLWMLTGCLMMLLNISSLEEKSIGVEPDSASYEDAILEILRNRTAPFFNPQTHLNALSKKIENDEKSETH